MSRKDEMLRHMPEMMEGKRKNAGMLALLNFLAGQSGSLTCT